MIMHYSKYLFITSFLLWCCPLFLSAREVRDTLISTTKDKVFVRYAIVEHDKKVTISFIDVRKQLGRKYQDIYDTPRDLDKIKVLFFDKGGPYKEDFRSDVGTEPLMVPSDEMRYHWSDEGYVWLDNNTIISLDLLAEQSSLSLPVYLTFYEGKHHYKVLTKCGNLNIFITQGKSQGGLQGTMTVVKEKQITTTEEVEVSEDITPTQEASLLVDNIREILGQGDLSVSELEALGRRADKLRDLEIIVSDKTQKKRIQSTLQMYDSRMTIAKQEQDDEDIKNQAELQRKAVEKQAHDDLAYVQERLENVKDLSESDLGDLKSSSNELRRKSHSIDNKTLATEMRETADKCDKEIKKIEDGKKKRNILLIIGGILLGILLFIGNQLFTHFRNIQNLKSMEDAQNKMAKRAANEARLRAQNMARSKVNRINGQIRQKSRDAVRDSVKNGVNNVKKGFGKNTKGLSI